MSFGDDSQFVLGYPDEKGDYCHGRGDGDNYGFSLFAVGDGTGNSEYALVGDAKAFGDGACYGLSDGNGQGEGW